MYGIASRIQITVGPGDIVLIVMSLVNKTIEITNSVKGRLNQQLQV